MHPRFPSTLRALRASGTVMGACVTDALSTCDRRANTSCVPVPLADRPASHTSGGRFPEFS